MDEPNKMKGGDVLNSKGLDLSNNDFGFEQNLGKKDTKNIPFFHAVMNMINHATNITCISWASLYGFIYRVDIPNDYQYFNYVGPGPNKNKNPLTSILLKVCIIEDNSTRLHAFSLNESSATSANPIKGMLTTTIDLMRSIVMNKLVQSKSYSKASVSLQELVNEVNTQQYIFKKTVGNQRDFTQPVCPSILDFFWFDKDKFYNTFLEKLHPEKNKFKVYLSDKKIGVIAMEYAGLYVYGDKFITFAEFYKKYHNDEIKMKIVLISIFTNIVRLALVPTNIFHCDLHANNIYVNEGVLNMFFDKVNSENANIADYDIAKKDAFIINEFMNLPHKNTCFSYILDFGRTITLDEINKLKYNINTEYKKVNRQKQSTLSEITEIFSEINSHANIDINDIEYILTVFKLIDEQYQKNHPAQSSFLYSLYEKQKNTSFLTSFLEHVLKYYNFINVTSGDVQNIFNNIKDNNDSYKVVGGNDDDDDGDDDEDEDDEDDEDDDDDDDDDDYIDINLIVNEAVKAVGDIIIPEPAIDVNPIVNEAVKAVQDVAIQPEPAIDINPIVNEAVKAIDDINSQPEPEPVININNIAQEAVKAIQNITSQPKSQSPSNIDIDIIVKEAVKAVDNIIVKPAPEIDDIVKEAIKVVEHLFSEEDNSWSVKIVETEEKNEVPFNNTTTTTLTKNGEIFDVKETSKPILSGLA